MPTFIQINGVDPFSIVYDGLDADSGGVDMAQLGKSLDGYARILATTSNFAVHYVYQKHYDAMDVRVRVQGAEKGSLTIKAVLDYLGQAQLLQGSIGAVLAAVITYTLGKLGRRRDEEEMKHLADITRQALEQAGTQNKETLDRLMALLDKMVDGLAPAARSAVTPIGDGCKEVSVLVGRNQVGKWEEQDKAAIRERAPAAIQPQQWYTVFVSELDTETGSAKVSFNVDDDHRVRARITDPLVSQPNNPYATALADKNPLDVQAKAEVLDGQIVQMSISDAKRSLEK